MKESDNWNIIIQLSGKKVSFVISARVSALLKLKLNSYYDVVLNVYLEQP